MYELDLFKVLIIIILRYTSLTHAYKRDSQGKRGVINNYLPLYLYMCICDSDLNYLCQRYQFICV